MYETTMYLMSDTLPMILAQAESGGGPRGAEFGKAAPTGAFIVVFFMAVVIALGLNLNKRIKHLNQRRAIAEEKGIDFFDPQTHSIAHQRAESFKKGEDYRGPSHSDSPTSHTSEGEK